MYIILFIWIYKYAPFLTTETNIEFLVVSNNHPHFVEQLDQNIYEVAFKLYWKYTLHYSSVPNRRAGHNKRAGGKILIKH